MSDNGKAAAAVALIIYLLAWNGSILIGTAYIVFGLGYSGWWWALAVLLMAGGSEKANL